MTDNLVTLATFDLTIKAALAQAALADAGIEATLADDNLVTMDWLLSNAVGGIKLVVRESDAERAVEVYHDYASRESTDPVVDEDELTRQALAAEPESDAAP